MNQSLKPEPHKRIAALIRMLAAPNDGEALSAARMLAKAISLDYLAGLVETKKISQPAPIAPDAEPAGSYMRGYQKGYSEGLTKHQSHLRKASEARRTAANPDLEERLNICLDYASQLRPHEQKFIDDLIERTDQLSVRQEKWLDSIVERVQR